MKSFILWYLLLTTALFAQSWTEVGNMPYPVSGGQAVVKGNMIYILGGFTDNNQVVDYIQAYNPQNNSWSIVGHMQYPRSEFVAGTFADSVVYFGGLKTLPTIFPFPDIFYTPGSIEVWNFKSSPYIYKLDSAFARSYSTGQVVNGNLYAFGGYTPPNINNNYLFGYNIESDRSIETNDSISTSHFSFDQMSVVVGNDIYIFGGTSVAPQRTIYDFDTKTNTLTDLHAELDDSRAGGAAVASDSVIYLIGGYSQSSLATRSVSTINLRKREFEQEGIQSLNYARRNPMAVNYYGSIYVFGGTDQNGQVVPQVEKYDTITGVTKSQSNVPNQFKLENNYPNPFNPSTQIAFKVGITARVSLDIYSILGEHIKTLTNKVFSPGEYSFIWNGTNDAGSTMSSGVYIYRLTSGYFTESKKMLLLK